MTASDEESVVAAARSWTPAARQATVSDEDSRSRRRVARQAAREAAVGDGSTEAATATAGEAD